MATSFLTDDRTLAGTARQGALRPGWVYVAIYAACAVLFTALYVHGTTVYPPTDLRLLTDFQAWTPFQYRLLLPLMVRALREFLPLPLPYLYYLLTLGFTLGLFLAFERFLRHFLPASVSRPATLGLLYPLLCNYCLMGHYYYPADVPSVFFFVAGLVCLIERRWATYFLLFALATLNRETSCFLIFAYLFTRRGEESAKQVAVFVLLQAVIWGIVKLILTHLLAGNLGEKMFENHFRANLSLFLPHGRLGEMRHGLKVFLICGAVWLLIPFAWRNQPLFFRRLLWVVVPFLLGMAVVGAMNETRLYNELIPVLLAPALYSLYVLSRTEESGDGAPGVLGPSKPVSRLHA